jgi:hypothetical protein
VNFEDDQLLSPSTLQQSLSAWFGECFAMVDAFSANAKVSTKPPKRQRSFGVKPLTELSFNTTKDTELLVEHFDRLEAPFLSWVKCLDCIQGNIIL